MAKLTATLPEASGVASPVAPVQSGGDFAGLASALSQGIGLAKQIQAENKRQEQGEAIASAQTGIIDLEDERNALLLEDQQLASQVQAISQDGITEEEQLQLDDLTKQREKLTKARRSGILNPLVFQTRMNALQKQALADVSNLAIQPQINALFAQGRSRITAPIGSAQKQMEEQMNAKYGVGNWSGVDLGRERGKEIYLRQLQADANNSFETFRGQEAIAAMNVYDDSVGQLRRALREQGALTDSDLDRYRASVNNITQELLSNLNSAVAANRQNGTPIDREAVKQSRENILNNQQFYLSMMEKGQEFGSGAMMEQRLKSMTNILDSVNKLKNPALASVATLVGANGSNGDLLTLAQVANAPEELLSGVIQNLPPQLQQTFDVNTLRTQAAQAVALALDGVDLGDLAESGMVSRTLAMSVAGIGLQNTPDSKTSNESYLSSLNAAQWQDTKGSLDLLNNPKTVTNLRNSKVDGKRIQSVVVHQIGNIVDQMQPEDFEAVSIDEAGNLQYTPKLSNRQRVMGGASNKSYMKNTIESLNKTLTIYEQELGGKAQYVQDLMFQRDIETQRQTGPTRTGKANEEQQGGVSE